MRVAHGMTLLIAAVPLGFAGCSGGEQGMTPAPTTDRREAAPAPPGDGPDAEVTAERDKLGAADRAAVDAQEWCVVNTGERLGSMGPPLKVLVKDQPVYVCCKGCVRTAQADPDKTLAAVAALKARATAGREKK